VRSTPGSCRRSRFKWKVVEATSDQFTGSFSRRACLQVVVAVIMHLGENDSPKKKNIAQNCCRYQ
jgi:hypothetical protein